MDFGIEFDTMLTDQLLEDSSPTVHPIYQTLGIEPDQKRLPPRKNLSALNFDSKEPDDEEEFEQQVQQQMVCLEKTECTDTTINGVVRVANVGLKKRVIIRHTRNNWRTHDDVIATYIAPESRDESGSVCSVASSEKSEEEEEPTSYLPTHSTERFEFELPVPKDFGVGSRVEFALCYEVNLQTFWNNQNGSNYVLECHTKDLNPHHIESAQWWHHFV